MGAARAGARRSCFGNAGGAGLPRPDPSDGFLLVLGLALRAVAEALELFLDLLELFVGAVLQVHQRVAGPVLGADQLIELEVDRLGVAVLRVLDQEHHQERHNRRRRINH